MKTGVSVGAARGGIATPARAGGTARPAVGRAGGIERGSFGSIDTGKFSSKSFAAFRTEKGKVMTTPANLLVTPSFDRRPKNYFSLAGNNEKGRNVASATRNTFQLTGFEYTRPAKSKELSRVNPRSIVFERPTVTSSPLIRKDLGRFAADSKRMTFPTKNPDKFMTTSQEGAPFRIVRNTVNGKSEYSIQALPRQPDRTVTEKRYGTYLKLPEGQKSKRFFGEKRSKLDGTNNNEKNVLAVNDTLQKLQKQLEKTNERKRYITRVRKHEYPHPRVLRIGQNNSNEKNASFKNNTGSPELSVNEKRIFEKSNALKTSPERNFIKKQAGIKGNLDGNNRYPLTRANRVGHALSVSEEQRLSYVRKQLKDILRKSYGRKKAERPVVIRFPNGELGDEFTPSFKRFVAPAVTERKEEKKTEKEVVRPAVTIEQIEPEQHPQPLKVIESAADLRQAARVKLALMNLYFTRDQAEAIVLPQLEEVIKKKQLPSPQLKQQVQTEDEWQLALKLKQKVEEEEELKKKLKMKTEEEEEIVEEELDEKKKLKSKTRPPEIVQEWDRETDEYRSALTENAVDVAAVKTETLQDKPGVLTGRVIANNLPVEQTPQMKSKLLYQIFALGDMLRDGSWETVRQTIASGGEFESKEDALEFVRKAISENPAVRLNDVLETRPVTQKDIAKVLEYHNAVVPAKTRRGKFKFMSVFH